MKIYNNQIKRREFKKTKKDKHKIMRYGNLIESRL